MIDSLVLLARRAGAIQLEHRRLGITHQSKLDNSPVTQADLDSQTIILEGLYKLSSAPVVSEEMEIPTSLDKKGEFWLVDPLDGTRDYVAGKKSFVVNISLIQQGRPVLGVMYAPAYDHMYWAEKDQGAYKDGVKISNESKRTALLAVASGSHASPRGQEFLEKCQVAQVERYGSALKLGHLAEGLADLYPRFGQTREWDTAAGHALLLEANCKLVDMISGEELRYGKPAFLNPGFMASRKDLDFLAPLNEVMRIRPD